MHSIQRLFGLMLLVAAGLAPAAGTPGPETPTAEALERSLTGRWDGALSYRDYQSGRRFELPLSTEITLGPDGATFTRVSRFDDGPVTGSVHITTVSLFDKTGNNVAHASFRKGRAVETWTDSARVLRHAAADDWTVVHERRGSDNNAPADIRLTQTRRAGELRLLKEVKAPGAADSAWSFRNETVLRRQP